MTQQELSINDKKQICKIVLQRLIQVGLSAPANRCITASISNKRSLLPSSISPQAGKVFTLLLFFLIYCAVHRLVGQ